MRTVYYRDAIREALDEEMARGTAEPGRKPGDSGKNTVICG